MKSSTVTLRFSELLLVLLKGKTSLMDALYILANDGIESSIKDSAYALLTMMKKGKSLSDSLRMIQSGKVFFEPLYLSLIAAGELTGNIETVLGRIVIDLQRKQRAKENAVNILIYPAVIVLLAVIGTIAIIVKGIPFFVSGGLISANVISDAKLGIAFAGTVLLTGGSALFLSYFKIFNNDSPESKIFYLLDLLLGSNVTMLDALSQCFLSLGESKFGKALLKIKKDISSGKSFSGAFAATKRFSAYVLGWLSIADKHGNLIVICESLSDYYAQKDNKKREAAAKLIEPAVIVLVGIYILIIITTVVLPLLNFGGGIL